MFAVLFVLVAFTIPPMIFWAFAYWLFPRSVRLRLFSVLLAAAALFAWEPKLLAPYLFVVPVFSFGIVAVFEWLLTRDRKAA